MEMFAFGMKMDEQRSDSHSTLLYYIHVRQATANEPLSEKALAR